MVTLQGAANTGSAAWGSPQMLASATGVTFPPAEADPPMRITSFTSAGSRGSRASASARFV